MKHKVEELIDQNTSLRSALKVVNKSINRIAIVVNKNSEILGTITDGDIRRALISKNDFKTKAKEIMNSTPLFAKVGLKNSYYLQIMKKNKRIQLPLIDNNNKIVKILNIKNLTEIEKKENLIFIFAGGVGKRLNPYTFKKPKPMLNIGDKPMLENLIMNFKKQGFYRFCIAVNYKKDQIINYFKDGKNFDIKIQYIVEEKPLGTAGALSQLETKEKKPIIVINADIVTNLNFNFLIEYYEETSSHITVCTYKYDYQVPFGVLDQEGIFLKKVKEKPVINFVINSGIYCISWKTVEILKKEEKIDMTELLKKAGEKKFTITVFPLIEKWMDVGRKIDLENARNNF